MTHVPLWYFQLQHYCENNDYVQQFSAIVILIAFWAIILSNIDATYRNVKWFIQTIALVLLEVMRTKGTAEIITKIFY